jgi:glycosyltransferase involved in cell wall biosynthesis
MHESPYTYEIIVVENGIVDANTERAFTGDRALYRTLMKSEKIRYFFEPVQCGPVARNTGARNAKGTYVMFMDAHTTLAKDSVAPLAEFLEKNPAAGGISGLTAWSYYDRGRMGSYYELFGGGGGPTLPSHMHGHYMPLGFVKHPFPFMAVMGSQAYTMYRTQDFLDIGGYCDSCRFYPHPEGYMPIKMWMTGKPMYVHQDSWHIHGMFHRHYERRESENIVERVRYLINRGDLTYEKKISDIRGLYAHAEYNEGVAKRAEYGGHSWSWHSRRNVLMIATILGGSRWLNICYEHLLNNGWGGSDARINEMEEIRDSALNTAMLDSDYDLLTDKREMLLTDVLILARKTVRLSDKERIWGMENWDKRIGDDPM